MSHYGTEREVYDERIAREAKPRIRLQSDKYLIFRNWQKSSENIEKKIADDLDSAYEMAAMVK